MPFSKTKAFNCIFEGKVNFHPGASTFAMFGKLRKIFGGAETVAVVDKKLLIITHRATILPQGKFSALQRNFNDKKWRRVALW